jgi:hypothetical protein
MRQRDRWTAEEEEGREREEDCGNPALAETDAHNVRRKMTAAICLFSRCLFKIGSRQTHKQRTTAMSAAIGQQEHEFRFSIIKHSVIVSSNYDFQYLQNESQYLSYLIPLKFVLVRFRFL